MKIVCAWCGKPLGEMPSGKSDPLSMTHGICPVCIESMLAQRGATLRGLLNRLDAPVAVMDGDCRVIAMNQKAVDIFGRSEDEIEGYLCGPAIECAYANLPEGCGQTEHCLACAIRRVIVDTYHTGQPHIRVPAYQDVNTAEGTRRKKFILSAEKSAGAVLLRIDKL